MRRYGISRPPNLSVGSWEFCNKTFRNRPRFNHWGEGFLVISCRPWALMAEGFYTRFNGVFYKIQQGEKERERKGNKWQRQGGKVGPKVKPSEPAADAHRTTGEHNGRFHLRTSPDGRKRAPSSTARPCTCTGGGWVEMPCGMARSPARARLRAR